MWDVSPGSHVSRCRIIFVAFRFLQRSSSHRFFLRLSSFGVLISIRTPSTASSYTRAGLKAVESSRGRLPSSSGVSQKTRCSLSFSLSLSLYIYIYIYFLF